MQPKIPAFLTVLLACAALSLAPAAQAVENVAIHPTLTPNRLGAATNFSATISFGSDLPGLQPPMVKVTAYGPAGMSVDVRGAGTCTASPATVVASGPSACPADSRIGFGKAVGLQELAGELIPGPFTFEFFLRPKEQGHLALMIYVNETTPASEQLVLLAKEVHAPKPYGLGISFAVPIVPSLPGAPLGWVDHLSLTLGSGHAAYRRTVHGKRRLVHVKGLIAPRKCPPGGFPIEGNFEFADGSTTTSKATAPCPGA
ncbi:MAG TPA: hypothetical protein VHW67_12685 [Solirubrobacteraceae bacterium]|nr:hypothetical protein [Solirubrobacteraceae bacterium]